MLNEEICKLRNKLNEGIVTGQDYSIIYQLSIELDELIGMQRQLVSDKNQLARLEANVISTEAYKKSAVSMELAADFLLQIVNNYSYS